MTRARSDAGGLTRCEAARAAWHDGCDGVLTGAAATEFAAHLAGCAACRAYAAQMEAICGGLAELSARSAAVTEAEERARVRVATQAVAARPWRRSARRLVLRIGLAATGAAAAVLAFVWYGEEFMRSGGGSVRRVDEIVTARVVPEVAERGVVAVEMVGESANRYVPIEQRTSVPAVHLFRVLPVIDAAVANVEGDPAAS